MYVAVNDGSCWVEPGVRVGVGAVGRVCRAFCEGVNDPLVGSRIGEEEGKFLENVRRSTTIELEEDKC